MKREWLLSLLVMVVTLVLCVGAGELVIRLKNSSMNNYDIEMWRYAKELKVKSPDPELDFDHLPSKSALLQHVALRLNAQGLRGDDLKPASPGERRVLLLGGSITMGWGVPEADTISALLQKKLETDGQKVQVLNGGIGNYNAERYVARYFKHLKDVQPTDIVVHYFLRDAEQLPPGGGNLLLRHSQLAVTLWIAYHRLFDRHGEQTLVDHYRAVYQPEATGFQTMTTKLRQLADHAREKGIRVYLAMVPDVHNLVDYKLGFVHDIMRRTAQEQGYVFVDLLPAMRGYPPQQLWAMPGDPHPNGLGHKLMADALYPVLDLRAKAGN